MASILEMKETRARIAAEMEQLNEKAKGEQRDLSDDEQEVFDRLDSEVSELNVRIPESEREERIHAVRQSLEARTRKSSVISDAAESEMRAFLSGESKEWEVNYNAADVRDIDRQHIRNPGQGPEARAVASHFYPNGSEQRSILTTTSGVSPGVIPISFVRQLREWQFETANIRQTNANVMVTSSGEPLRVPRMTALPTAGIIGEGVTKTESLGTYGSVVLGAYKYANFTQVSEEFAQDEAVNFLDHLARVNGIAMGLATDNHYINGNGTTQPEGVITALVAASGRVLTGAATSGNVTAITVAELLRIRHGIATPYRNRAYWLMNDATFAIIEGLRTNVGGAGTGEFMFGNTLAATAGPTLLGRPVVLDPNMPTMAASANSIVYGDFSGFYIRDVGNFRFERSDDYAFQNDLVSFRAVERTDSKLVDPQGLVLWKNAAT